MSALIALACIMVVVMMLNVGVTVLGLCAVLSTLEDLDKKIEKWKAK